LCSPNDLGSSVYHNGMRLGVTTVGVGALGSFVVNALGDRFIAENKIMGGITNNSVYGKAAEQIYTR